MEISVQFQSIEIDRKFLDIAIRAAVVWNKYI